MNNIKKFNNDDEFTNHDCLDCNTIPPIDMSISTDTPEPFINTEPEQTELTPSIEENPVVIDGGKGENLHGCCQDYEQKEPTSDVNVCCNTDNLTIGDFFGTIMESVQISWRYHLKATRHSIHTILEEYYSDAQEIIDTIIESYQGKFGVVTEYGNRIFECGKSCLEYLQELRDFIENGKLMLPEITSSSEILSEIDTLTTKIDTTLYKLKNLTENRSKYFKQFDEYIKR